MVLKDVKIKILTDSISLQVSEPETPLHGLLVNMAHAWKFCCKEKPDDFTYMFQQSRDGVALKTWELRSFEYHGVETLGNTVSRPSFYLLESGWGQRPGTFRTECKITYAKAFATARIAKILKIPVAEIDTYRARHRVSPAEFQDLVKTHRRSRIDTVFALVFRDVVPLNLPFFVPKTQQVTWVWFTSNKTLTLQEWLEAEAKSNRTKAFPMQPHAFRGVASGASSARGKRERRTWTCSNTRCLRTLPIHRFSETKTIYGNYPPQKWRVCNSCMQRRVKEYNAAWVRVSGSVKKDAAIARQMVRRQHGR